MNDANVELTQVLSQVSGPAVLSVADDLMQTRRMTIEDLIESTEVIFCFGFESTITMNLYLLSFGFCPPRNVMALF
jgi:hypothetical protein